MNKFEALFNEAESMSAELTAIRRTLHTIPEAGLSLPKTVALVREQLDAISVPYTLSENMSSVTALIGSGPNCFLIRGDMDALPMTEETGLPFASKNKNMHACGHDMHTASLLGAARLLKKHEKELCGTVKLLFQPGEETFEGAKTAVSEGVLENPHVDAAFAVHIAPLAALGNICYGDFPQAAVYGFEIELLGKGGHGSAPETCIDPINTGVHIYLALQELMARECPPSKEAALTVGSFSAGTASNIIPQRAVLKGTLRTFDRELQKYLIKRISEVSKGVAAAYRTGVSIKVSCDVPAVENDPKLSQEFIDCIKNIKPGLKLQSGYHSMGSDDFAFISERVPSCYFSVGAAVEERSKIVGLHNPKVLFDERYLPFAAAVYASVSINWLTLHAPNIYDRIEKD